MRSIADHCDSTRCLIPYESDKLTLKLPNGKDMDDDDIKAMCGIIISNKAYWNGNVKESTG